MFENVLFGLVCLLAVYGGLAIIVEVVEDSRYKPYFRSSNIKVAIIVKNAEENIEAVVRNVLSNDFQGKALSASNIAFVDLGSEDDTLRILEKLSCEEQYFELYKNEERYKVFSDLS